MACFCDDVARLQSALPPEDGLRRMYARVQECDGL